MEEAEVALGVGRFRNVLCFALGEVGRNGERRDRWIVVAVCVRSNNTWKFG